MSKKKNLSAEPADAAPHSRILCLETATDVSSVALFEDGALVGLQENHANRTHARLVTVMIQRMLQDHDLRPADLTAVAVTKGPGSYTGLRVGVSVAKGLCMALDIPLLSVGSLESLAASVTELAQELDAEIWAMIDARRMEVFGQHFDAQGHPRNAADAIILEEDSFTKDLAEGRIIFVGDGVEKCRSILKQHPGAVVLGQQLSSAANMGKVAQAKLDAGDVEDLVTFEPFYLKEFVATLAKKKVL